jgi:hypothetical protein
MADMTDDGTKDDGMTDALSAEGENRIQILVEAGVVESPADFSSNAKKVINRLSETEFNSVLTIRRQIISIAGQEALDAYDKCFSFIT